MRRGAGIGLLPAGGAIAGAIAMLAFAPRAAASTSAAIFVTNAYCDTVTAYPTGASGNVTPISPVSALCLPTSVALDSKGNIYVVNHLSSAVTVYPAGSNGPVAPSAIIAGSNTALNAPWGVAFDASANIYVSNYDGRTVTIYPAGSNGNVAPSAIIGGSNTGLIFPHGIALDASGNIYVANHGSSNGVADTVTVYPAGSNGNVAPIATIGGSQTGLNDPRGIALDANGNIYVANFHGSTVTVYPAGSNGNVAPSSTIESSDVTGLTLDASGNIYVTKDSGYTVSVYPAGSNGNVAPSSTISGSNTGLNAWDLAVDATGNTYVANGNNTVTVYAAGSIGNVTPSSTIRSNTVLNYPVGLALDVSGNIYVTNDGIADAGPYTVTVYPAGSNANAAPSSTIAGSNTGLSEPAGIAMDASGNIYVANDGSENGGTDAVTVYPPGSSGNVAPSATVSGSNTGLDDPQGIALDAAGNIYVANDGSENGGTDTVTVYPAGRHRNIAPSSTIAGSNTGLSEPAGIVLDAGGNIYVTNDGSAGAGPYTVTVYPAGSNGNVAPSATVSASNTGLDDPQGIALDAGGNIYVANGGFYATNHYPEDNTVTVYPAGSDGNVAPSATIAGPTTELAQPAGIAIGPEQPPSPTATPTPTPTPSPAPTFAAGGTLSLSSHAIAFGNVGTGTTAKRALKITNIGTGTLSGNVNISGLPSPLFTVTAGSGPFSLAHDRVKSVTILCAPGAQTIPAVNFSGAIVITSGDGRHLMEFVTLSATGETGMLSVPAAINLTVPHGKKKSGNLVIKNRGLGVLHVTANFSGLGSPFSATPTTSPFTLAHDQNHALVVRFAPPSAGSFKGTINFTSDDPSHPSVTVTVTGVAT